MNILIINYEFPPVGGGGGVATYYIARELCQMGYAVSVLTSHFRDLRWCEDCEGIQIYRVPVLRERRDFCSVFEMLSFILAAFPMLVYLLCKYRYNLIHVFFGIPCGPLGYVARKLFGIPYLIRMGGGDVPGFRIYQYKRLYTVLIPVLKLLWRNAEFLVANSEGLRKMANQVFPEFPVQVIPNGVDVGRFRNGRHRRPAKEVRILFLSRLIRRKGLQFLIDAIPIIREHVNAPFVVKVVGDGPSWRRFTKHVAGLGLNQYFQFHGYVEHSKLPAYYLDADLFVLPSLAEGMPNVVLEAMGSGLPIIATRVAGSEELVREGENGLLVEPHDVDSLAQAVITLINDSALREQMGKRGKELVHQYSWRSVTEQYIELYRRMGQNSADESHEQTTKEFLAG